MERAVHTVSTEFFSGRGSLERERERGKKGIARIDCGPTRRLHALCVAENQINPNPIA